MGSILSEGEESPSPELIQLYQKFGFKVFSFPAPSHVVTATFPYTTTLSIWLAARRVHPALDAYIKVRHRPDVCVGGWGAASTLGGSRGAGGTAQAGRERWFWEGSTLGPSRRRCLWSWVDGQRLLASLPHDLAGTGVPASSMGACSETPPGEFSSGWDQRQPWCSAPTPALNGQADPPRPRPAAGAPRLAGPRRPCVTPGPVSAGLAYLLPEPRTGAAQAGPSPSVPSLVAGHAGRPVCLGEAGEAASRGSDGVSVHRGFLQLSLQLSLLHIPLVLKHFVNLGAREVTPVWAWV